MKLKTTYALFVSGLLAILALTSCATGPRLNAQAAQGAEIAGTYNVIFYGCNYFNDPETVVFLDKVGDPYTFEPFAPDFVYRIKKGLPASEALAEADNFPNCTSSFRYAQVRRIAAPSGDILGYELRPLYHSFVFGRDDVLNVDYLLKDDKVVIYVTLDPSVEKMLREGSSRKRMRD
ncbi:MAG: hypothetical protein FIA94_11675 [Nitrospirae bacterium]|nr:hypothetical protein [Nitrospirota bacterium]